MICLTIYTLPPSLNQLERMHWAKKGRLRALFARELFYADPRPKKIIYRGAHLRGMPPEMYRPRKLRLSTTIYWKTRRLDEDNAMGSLKIIIDAMRDVGLIFRDSPKWLRVEKPVQKLDHDHPRVEIEVEELT